MSRTTPASAAAPRRGRPKSEDLNGRLLEAAIGLFAGQGVDRTTTREIAALARTTERTLFQHFGSKDGLLEAVIDRAVLAHTVPESLAGLGDDIRAFDGDLEAWHRRLLRSRLAAWSQAGQLTKVLLVELLRRPRLQERFEAAWRPAAWEPLVALFASLREQGVLRDDVDAPGLARQFLRGNVAFLMMRVMMESSAVGDDEAEIAAIARLFARGAGA